MLRYKLNDQVYRRKLTRTFIISVTDSVKSTYTAKFESKIGLNETDEFRSIKDIWNIFQPVKNGDQYTF